MTGLHKRLVHIGVLGTLITTLVLDLPVATAQTPGPVSLRVFSVESSVELPRYRRSVPLELPVYIAPVGGDFELRVWRDDYDSPVRIAQFDAATGEMVRELPAERLDSWSGLADFIEVTLHDAAGELVASTSSTFCPNSWERQRVDDHGEPVPTYPTYCGSYFPFVRGMVWGLERGWATGALSQSFQGDFGIPTVHVPEGEYTVTVSIAPDFQELLGIAAEDATVELHATVKQARRRRFFEPHHRHVASHDSTDGGVPDVSAPPAAALPDLIALPAWNITTFNRRDKDLLAFAATLWNGGPAPFVVEGFRRSDETVMDAFQYFYDGDEAVGRTPIGTMEWDTRHGHHHWHFEQFASFSLLNFSKTDVVKSTKQSFCIVPTDAVDLTIEGAQWNPHSLGIGTACGGARAIWVRETLEPGWGDTYFQQVAGQSFNVTNVPNGWYHIEVRVNTNSSMIQTSTENDVEHRLIYLHGSPGNRKVVALPWHGIRS